tara:strand:- start:205 stop:354 length:150 start_codon:yes stop_codon:yes gene_type:complete
MKAQHVAKNFKHHENINFDFASFADDQRCGCRREITMNSTNITALYRKL